MRRKSLLCRVRADMATENGVVAQAQAQMQDLSMGNGQIVAVGEARTVLPSPNLSQVKSVDTQTRAIGLIQPPPDIRAIVDKTADFVGRNGAFKVHGTYARTSLIKIWAGHRQEMFTSRLVDA